MIRNNIANIDKIFLVAITMICMSFSQTYISDNTKAILKTKALLFEQLNGKESNEIISILSSAISNATINVNAESDAYDTIGVIGELF